MGLRCPMVMDKINSSFLAVLALSRVRQTVASMKRLLEESKWILSANIYIFLYLMQICVCNAHQSIFISKLFLAFFRIRSVYKIVYTVVLLPIIPNYQEISVLNFITVISYHRGSISIPHSFLSSFSYSYSNRSNVSMYLIIICLFSQFGM